ncbi:Hypothetical predicted protein, partial [Pelobates cultripes]
ALKSLLQPYGTDRPQRTSWRARTLISYKSIIASLDGTVHRSYTKGDISVVIGGQRHKTGKIIHQYGYNLPGLVSVQTLLRFHMSQPIFRANWVLYIYPQVSRLSRYIV